MWIIVVVVLLTIAVGLLACVVGDLDKKIAKLTNKMDCVDSKFQGIYGYGDFWDMKMVCEQFNTIHRRFRLLEEHFGIKREITPIITKYVPVKKQKGGKYGSKQ